MNKYEFIGKTMKLADAFYKQLSMWYTEEKDISLVPDPVIEGFIGLCGSLYLTFSYEMEELDKWYAVEFIKIKTEEAKPLSDKLTDQILKTTEKGQRMIVLDRRMKSLKFMKEALNRSAQARIEANKQTYHN